MTNLFQQSQPLLAPPNSKNVTETRTSTYWFDEDILYIIGKKEQVPCQERQRQMQEFLVMLNGKKVCAIMDISQSPPTDHEMREYNLKILPRLFKCVAFITASLLDRVLVNLYLGVSPLPLPSKIFSTEEEARNWVKHFLKCEPDAKPGKG